MIHDIYGLLKNAQRPFRLFSFNDAKHDFWKTLFSSLNLHNLYMDSWIPDSRSLFTIIWSSLATDVDARLLGICVGSIGFFSSVTHVVSLCFRAQMPWDYYVDEEKRGEFVLDTYICYPMKPQPCLPAALCNALSRLTFWPCYENLYFFSFSLSPYSLNFVSLPSPSDPYHFSLNMQQSTWPRASHNQIKKI